MPYRVEFTRAADRQFRRLSRSVQTRLKGRIDALSLNPFPAGTEKLAGAEDHYRIRAGDYRVIYTLRHAVLLVLVVRVGHRREVYRRP